MEFHVYETGETVKAEVRPIVIITSRTTRKSCRTPSCAAASSISSPSRTRKRWRAIVEVHFPKLKGRLLSEALKKFYEVQVALGAGPEKEALQPQSFSTG